MVKHKFITQYIANMGGPFLSNVEYPWYLTKMDPPDHFCRGGPFLSKQGAIFDMHHGYLT